MKQHVRTLGLVEASSLLVLLLVAMPLKYWLGMPAMVKVVGTLHGFLFMFYIGAVVIFARELGWNFRKVLFAFALSSIPLGPMVFDRRLFPRN